MKRSIYPARSKVERRGSGPPLADDPGGVLRIHVELRPGGFSVWRRVLVDEAVRGSELRTICRIAIGWPAHGPGAAIRLEPIAASDLRTEPRRPGEHFSFEHAGWSHSVRIEDRLERDERNYPLCIEGEGKCPPPGGERTVEYAEIVRDADRSPTRIEAPFGTSNDSIRDLIREANHRFREGEHFLPELDEPEIPGDFPYDRN